MAYFLSLCLFPFFSFSISFTTFFFFSKRWCKSPKLCSRDSSSSQTSSSFSTRKITNPWLYNFWRYLQSLRFRKLLFRCYSYFYYNVTVKILQSCFRVSLRAIVSSSKLFFFYFYLFCFHSNANPQKFFAEEKHFIDIFFSFTRIRWARCASLIAST